MRLLVLRFPDAVPELDEFNAREKQLIIEAAMQADVLLTPFVYLVWVFVSVIAGCAYAAVGVWVVDLYIAPAHDFFPNLLVVLTGVVIAIAMFVYFRDGWVRWHVRRWLTQRRSESKPPVPVLRSRPLSHNLCVECGYDLKGIPAEDRRIRCPECGVVKDMAMWESVCTRPDPDSQGDMPWPEVEACRAHPVFKDHSYAQCCGLIKTLELVHGVSYDRMKYSRCIVYVGTIGLLCISCIYAVCSPYPDILVSVNLLIGLPIVIWILFRAANWRLQWLQETLVVHLTLSTCSKCGTVDPPQPVPVGAVHPHVCHSCRNRSDALARTGAD